MKVTSFRSGSEVSIVYKYRYVIVSLCTAAALLEYATRTNINNAIVSMVSRSLNGSTKSIVSDFCGIPKHIQESSESINGTNYGETYDWDQQTTGTILGAFFFGYIFLQIPAGRLSEIFGGKWIVFVGIFMSGLINVLTPLLASAGVPILITSRIVLGLVQGGVYPACFSLIISWFPKDEKAFGFGLVSVGGNLGAVSAAAVTGYLSQHVSWMSSFYVIGGIAVAYTLLWVFLVKSNPAAPRQQASSMVRIPWHKILTNRAVLACIVVRFGGSFAYLTLQTKLPGYLQDILHIEPNTNGLLNSMLYIAVSVSVAASSYLSEIVIGRKWLSRTNTRKAFSGVGLFGTCLCFVLVPSTNCNSTAAMVLLIGGITFYGVTYGGDNIVPAELSKRYPTTIYALVNMCANFAGMIAPIAIGAVLNAATDGTSLKHAWDMVFYGAAGIVSICAIIFVFGASAEYQESIDKWDRPDDKRNAILNKLSIFCEL